VNNKTGEPLELDVSGSPTSFEALFNECIKSRGVTYKSLMRQLIESNSIEFDKQSQKLKLMINAYLPSESKDKLGSIEMGFSALGNLIDTVTRNIDSLESETDRFYQRGAWTYRLSKENSSELRARLKPLLEQTDSKARLIIEQYEDNCSTSDQIRAGVSLFYFEEEKESND
jgi:hypothetical protein